MYIYNLSYNTWSKQYNTLPHRHDTYDDRLPRRSTIRLDFEVITSVSLLRAVVIDPSLVSRQSRFLTVFFVSGAYHYAPEQIKTEKNVKNLCAWGQSFKACEREIVTKCGRLTQNAWELAGLCDGFFVGVSGHQVPWYPYKEATTSTLASRAFQKPHWIGTRYIRWFQGHINCIRGHYSRCVWSIFLALSGHSWQVLQDYGTFA